MRSKVEEALRSLCCQYGWSYGVYWSVDGGDPGLLKMGGAYYEEQVGKVMDDLLHQAHRVGEGTIGGSVLSGKHCWISSETLSEECSLIAPADNPDIFKGDAMWNLQFLTGIKTIAIIPLPPLGVLQFGSFQKIPESSEFINQVKCACQPMDCFPEPSMIHKVGETSEIITPAIPSGDPYFLHKNFSMNSMNNNGCMKTLPEKQYPTASVTSPLVSQCSSLNANLPSMPVHKAYSLRDDTSLLLKQIQASITGDQFMVSPNTHLQQDILQATSCSPVSLLTSNYLSNSSSEELLALMEQHLLKMIGMEQFSTTSQSVTSHSHQFYGNSSMTSLHGTGGPFNAVGNRGSLEISKPIQDIPHPLPTFPVLNGGRPSNKYMSEGPSFSMDPPVESTSFLTFSEDLAPGCDASADNMIQSNHKLKQESYILTVSRNDNLLDVISSSSGFGCTTDFPSIPGSEFPSVPSENRIPCPTSSLGSGSDGKGNYSNAPAPIFSDNDLFDGMELDLRNCNQELRCWDDIIMPEESANCSNLSTGVLECIPGMDLGAMEGPDKEFFSNFGFQQLADVVDGGNINSVTTDRSISNIDSVVSHNSDNQYSTTTNVGSFPSYSNQVTSAGLPYFRRSTSLSLPECKLEKITEGSSNAAHLKSQLSSWIDDCYSMNAVSAVTSQTKKPEEQAKVVRKRARPGESTRPRPKDRQLIQDRVKELREIVPNCSKCSIDALLDRTIKHMLYLQNVTKYSEKLKQADEPKMIGDESGVVLRDNSSGGGGGATWAFEVAGQTMVCPIIVEDLSPPGQMLVEMLCEERGFFLEIADIIRGFGLTILKGVMEVRHSKIWARFLVEANRDVTRMEIFLSLVQLLQQTTSSPGPSSQPTKKETDNGIPAFDNYKQSPLPIPISLPDRLQ